MKKSGNCMSITNILPELSFFEKSKSGRITDESCNVSIRLGKSEESVNIIIRDDLSSLFGTHLIVAPYKSRLYLQGADSSDGWTIKLRGHSGFIRIRCNINNGTSKLKDFVGNYQLKFDDSYRCYYVESRGDLSYENM